MYFLEVDLSGNISNDVGNTLIYWFTEEFMRECMNLFYCNKYKCAG